MARMRKARFILITLIAIGSLVILSTLVPNFFMRLFVHSKKQLVHSPSDIENALLELKQEKQQPFAAHIIFEISRKPHTAWSWIANWKGASVEHYGLRETG